VVMTQTEICRPYNNFYNRGIRKVETDVLGKKIATKHVFDKFGEKFNR
jgi:hypothetical protein